MHHHSSFRCLLLLYSVLLLTLSLTMASALADQRPYSLGVILPMSGEAAGLGLYVRQGVELAYETLPEDDRKLLTLRFEDDQLDHRQSVAAFRKLNDIEGIDGVFVVGSGVGNAVGPLAEREKKLMIAIGASDSSLSKGTEYVFIHWVSPQTEAQLLAEEVQRRGYSSIGIIGVQQEGMLAVLSAVDKAFERRQLDKHVKLRDSVLLEQMDFRTFITKARARDLDAVLIGLFPGQMASFAKQARGAGLKSEFFGFELFEDEKEVKAADGKLEGTWFVNADIPTKEFTERYRARYQEHPGWGAANAYDSLKLLVSALKSVGKDNAKVAKYLRYLKDFSGAHGTYSANGINGFELPATVKIVHGESFPVVARSEASGE